ncbi:MAG: hypothetical protein ACPID7_03110, partial [Candidatus Puniceispirillum sp.]
AEAAAVGAFGALVLSYFYKTLKWKNFKESVFLTAKTTAMDGQKPPARALSGKEKRQNTAHVRSAITKAEKMLEKLAKQKADIEEEMAKPGFFEAANQSRAADAGKILADLNEAIEHSEEEWLTLQEKLASALDA